jgi:ABC-type transporter Mla maintaining outer membrane lipid asymmetry ATPase subunit MlaF
MIKLSDCGLNHLAKKKLKKQIGKKAMMTKRALLEEIYNSAFNDELEKIANILRQGGSVLSRSLSKQQQMGRRLVGIRQSATHIPAAMPGGMTPRNEMVRLIKLNKPYY